MNVQKFFILNDPFPIKQHRLLLATSALGTEQPMATAKSGNKDKFAIVATIDV
jgi:hypothetical protein